MPYARLQPLHSIWLKIIRLLKALQIKRLFPEKRELVSAGKGLGYLTALYIELLQHPASNAEIGPKGKLSLMSRTSFSEMYGLLTEKDKSDFKDITDKVIEYKKSIAVIRPAKRFLYLFNKPYALYYGINIFADAPLGDPRSKQNIEILNITSNIRNIINEITVEN